MVEEWRDVVGYEGLYQVSNLGRVKSLEKTVPHPTAKSGYWVLPEKIRKLKVCKNNGYLMVILSRHNRIKNWTVHRLVALAFLEKVEGKDSIDHIDGNKLNNSVDNLRWCTRKENNNNPKTSWKIPLREYKKGSESSPARKVKNVETGVVFGCVKDAAASIKRTRGAIWHSATTGGIAGGFHWRYV